MTKNKVSTHSTLVKESLSFQRTPLVKLLRLSFILSLVNIVVVLLIKNFLPPQIPLYYGLAEGQEQLSGTLGLVVPGILSLSLTSVNTIIMFFVKDNFIKHLRHGLMLRLNPLSVKLATENLLTKFYYGQPLSLIDFWGIMIGEIMLQNLGLYWHKAALSSQADLM